MVTTTHTLQFLTPFTITSLLNRTSPRSVCCFSARTGGRSGGSGRESRTGNGQQRFRFDDEFRANGGEKDADFGFGAATKQRVWWSDDDSSRGDVYDDEDEDEDFEGFGGLEGSIGFSWIFKVLQAFGWMIPAVLASMVLGTGTNTIFMALALPLAQSALSLIMDKFSGTSYDRSRPKSRTRKRPYARAKTRTREGEQNTQSGKESGGYRSWVRSNEKEARTAQSFGGWDELDNTGTESANKTPKTTAAQDPNKTRQRSQGKLSRRISKKETPFLLRLLIAVFPFLGSWTKVL